MISIYLIIKILHVFGFTVVIGTTVASTIAYRYFWRQYYLDRALITQIFQLIQGVQIAGMIGMIILLLAGFTMLGMAHGSFASVLWFQIKLGLVVLVFVNGLTLGRTTAAALKRLVEQEGSAQSPAPNAASVKFRAQLFSAVQLTIFATIVILSVLKIS